MKEPNDDNLTVSPFSRQSVISFKTSSTNADDSLSDSPTCRYTAPDRSTRVTVFRVPVIACPNSRRRKFVSEIKRLLTRGQWCSALKQTFRCQHRDLILTRSAYDHKRMRPLKPMVGVVKSLGYYRRGPVGLVHAQKTGIESEKPLKAEVN